ncbi:MAG: hypothetical protein AAGA06_13570 [Pseudomonadota bacterium]
MRQAVMRIGATSLGVDVEREEVQGRVIETAVIPHDILSQYRDHADDISVTADDGALFHPVVYSINMFRHGDKVACRFERAIEANGKGLA